MTDLIDDTQLLLAVGTEAVAPTDPLWQVSAAVVTRASLQAKALAYDLRLTRALALAANQGAGLAELADAAGMSADEVRGRLAGHPELLDPASRDRLLVPVRRQRW